MAAIDKAARLEAERQKADAQSALKVQQLDPPFPFKVAKVDLRFFGFRATSTVTNTGISFGRTA
jgi:hypothetical protein